MHPKNGRLHIQKSIIVIYNLKDQSPMNISIDAKRTFDKILQPFMIETLSKLGIERNFLNLLGVSVKNPQLTWKAEYFDYDVYGRRKVSIFTTLFNKSVKGSCQGSWAKKRKYVNDI